MSKKGFIKIQRKLFDNFLWNEARVFSKAEAWIDMIQSARFEATQEVIQNKVIELQKGELPASRRYLEKRWGWGGTKVTGFLKTLDKLGMIDQRISQGQTIINLSKYCEFQKKQSKDKPPNKPRANHEQTTSKPNIKNLRIKELEDDEESKKDVYIDIEIHFENYLKNKRLIEAITGSQKISEQQLQGFLKNFVSKLKDEGKFAKTEDDFQTHFASWLKIQVKKSNKNGGKGKNTSFD